MNVRKEKEKEFFVQHMDTFRAIGNPDPFFIIKTAFFQKGKFGRHVQFFESEVGKGEDIYVEFYDNVTDANNVVTNVIPFSEDRQLFKYKYNPYFQEEYEKKEGISFKGDPYLSFTVPVSELTAIMSDGSEITYNLYEKRKAEREAELPKQQNKLSVFPDFEQEFSPAVEETASSQSVEDAPFSELTIRDLAAIMLMKPVSNKKWLNDLVNTKDKAPWE
jgi:hypothetical protein